MVPVGIRKLLGGKKKPPSVMTLRGKALAEPSKAGGGASFLSL